MSDGGPAFARPSSEAVDMSGQHFWPGAQEGMSLRDYFAAAALTAYIVSADAAWRNDKNCDDIPTLTEYARTAYRIADAMLAAREKQNT